MRVGGIAKGSGMIHPNMATMLCVITSDADAAPELWREVVRRGSINSFNQVHDSSICLSHIHILDIPAPLHSQSPQCNSTSDLFGAQESRGLLP